MADAAELEKWRGMVAYEVADWERASRMCDEDEEREDCLASAADWRALGSFLEQMEGPGERVCPRCGIRDDGAFKGVDGGF